MLGRGLSECDRSKKSHQPTSDARVCDRVFSGFSRRTVRANRAGGALNQVEFVGPESLSEFG